MSASQDTKAPQSPVSFRSLDKLRDLRRQVGRARSSQALGKTFDAASVERSAAALQMKNEHINSLGPAPRSSITRPSSAQSSASAFSAQDSSGGGGGTSKIPVPHPQGPDPAAEPLHKSVDTLWAASRSAVLSEWEGKPANDRLPFATVSLKVFAQVLRGVLPVVPKLAAFFSDLATTIDGACDEAAHLQISLAASLNELRQVRVVVDGKIADLAAEADRRVRTAVNGVLQRDNELAALAALNTAMAGRLKAVEEECSDLKQQLAALNDKDMQSRRDIDIKRTQMDLLQTKMNTVIRENLYLREIAKHNRDLLWETDQLKEQRTEAVTAKALAVEETVAVRTQAYKDKEGAVQSSKKLVAALRAAELEVAQLRRQHEIDESFHSKCKADRDEMVAHRTPRPAKGAIAGALVAAGKVLGDDSLNSDALEHQPTAKLLELAAMSVRRLSSFTATLKSKVDTEQRLLEYVNGDDFEGVSRALQSVTTDHLGQSTVVPRGGGPVPAYLQRAIVPFPLHSRTVVLEGVWSWLGASDAGVGSPLLGGEAGRVGVRSMALEELLLLVDRLLADRRQALGPDPASPWSSSVRLSLQKLHNISSPSVLIELIATLEYSLDLFAAVPQVELFRRIIRRQAPEELFADIIGKIDEFCRACAESKDLRVVPLGGKATVRVLKKSQIVALLQKTFPSLADADMFRLLAVAATEMLSRLSMADSKAIAQAGKDDVALDTILVAPDGKDGEVLTATIALGSPSGRSTLATFRRPGGCLLAPFLSAVFRQAAQQYEVCTQNAALELAAAVAGVPPAEAGQGVLSGSRQLQVTKEKLVAALAAAGSSAPDVVADAVLSRLTLQNPAKIDQVTLGSVCAALRAVNLRFPGPRLTSPLLGELSAPMEHAKLIDAAKKNILGLRSF
jgi:hypothetical protein